MKGPKTQQPRRRSSVATTSVADFAPVPRRAKRPRWLDPRIIGGLLLVIAAVVIGAKVIGASSKTATVWAASRDLAAGTVLTAADVTPVDVNLAGSSGHYLTADPTTVVGRALSVPVRGGELLPSSALDEPMSGRVVVIGVAAERMPPGVTHGSRVDVYLTTGSQGSADQKTDILSRGLIVQSVTVPSSGGLSGSGSRYQLAVLLDAKAADDLVRKLPGGEPAIALVSGR